MAALFLALAPRMAAHEPLQVPVKEERCKFGTTHMWLPVSVFQPDILAHVFSLDTWNSISEEERTKLRHFLPDLGADAQAQEKCLKQLFSGENFCFGNPARRLEKDLRAGVYNAEVARARQQTNELQHRLYLHHLMEYHSALMQRLVRAKRELGIVDRGDFLLEAECDYSDTESESGAESSATDSDPEWAKRKVLQPLEVDLAATLSSPTKNPVFSAFSNASSPFKLTEEEPIKKKAKKEYVKRHEMPPPEVISPYVLFIAMRQALKKQSHTPEITTLPERVWLPGYTQLQMITIALNFLRLPPQLPTVLEKKTALTENTSPLVQKANDEWKWVRETSEGYLRSLEQLYYFAVGRFIVDDKRTHITQTNFRQVKIVSSISLTPPPLIAEIRERELERYKRPDLPFAWEVGTIRSCVAGLKAKAMATGGARNHVLLKMERPSHATILALVRDATARLPGGVGNRMDVVTLLRDSQYIVEGATDSALNQVASGALDRLHTERDPCVVFDGDQKMWIYLHRTRSIEDFLERERREKLQAAEGAGPV